MTDKPNGSTIITPETAVIEHKEKVRRLRKPTLGEVEDMMNDMAHIMLQQYGPLAVVVRELNQRCTALETALARTTGDVE